MPTATPCSSPGCTTRRRRQGCSSTPRPATSNGRPTTTPSIRRWHPDAANGGDDSRPYRFTFRASDGRAVTAQIVEVRVFDVNRSPRVRVGNHAVVVGDTASIPVVFGDAAPTGIALDDPDGAARRRR
jgi:hypothetical protein